MIVHEQPLIDNDKERARWGRNKDVLRSLYNRSERLGGHPDGHRVACAARENIMLTIGV